MYTPRSLATDTGEIVLPNRDKETWGSLLISCAEPTTTNFVFSGFMSGKKMLIKIFWCFHIYFQIKALSYKYFPLPPKKGNVEVNWITRVGWQVYPLSHKHEWTNNKHLKCFYKTDPKKPCCRASQSSFCP